MAAGGTLEARMALREEGSVARWEGTRATAAVARARAEAASGAAADHRVGAVRSEEAATAPAFAVAEGKGAAAVAEEEKAVVATELGSQEAAAARRAAARAAADSAAVAAVVGAKATSRCDR
jgi:hypothetical protein